MGETCICGHEPNGHRRLEPAGGVTAGFIDPDDPPQVSRHMRSYCGAPVGPSRWDRCRCVLYTATATLAAQFGREAG